MADVVAVAAAAGVGLGRYKVDMLPLSAAGSSCRAKDGIRNQGAVPLL